MQVCASIFTTAQGEVEKEEKMGWREGGKRKWYENVSSALFMEPVEEHGRRLGHLPQPAHTFVLPCEDAH